MKTIPYLIPAILVIMLSGCTKKSETVDPVVGSVTQPLSTTLVAPTITDFTVPDQVIGGTPYKIVPPKSNSTGAFTYVLYLSASNVATLSGTTITAHAVGRCSIYAIQAASGNFKRDSIMATFNVTATALIKPTITDFAITAKTVGQAFTLVKPKSNSTGAFYYYSSNPNLATVNGSTVTAKAVGTVTITALQAAAGNYKADSIKATFTITKAAGTPTITGFTIPTKRMGDLPFALTRPTSNSTGAFTYKSSNTALATISGSTVTLKAPGTVTITAYQAAAGAYKADSIKATFIIAPYLAPSITWVTIADKKTTDKPFTLTVPKSNSAGAFTYTSSNVNLATVSGNVVTIHGPGQCVITATQAANGNYLTWTAKAAFSIYPPPVTGTVADVDANVYKTIVINGKTWMAENLRVAHYQDGTGVANVEDATKWASLTTGAYCYYNADAKTAAIYGKLYNWYAAGNTRKLAPKGWHVATDAEWTALYNYLGGVREGGTDIQEAGTAHWQVAIGTNSTLFTGLPGGYRSANGAFGGLGSDGIWWTATQSTTANAWYYHLYVKGYLERHDGGKSIGYSVRCVKD